jgi:xanthine dehydrogenase molybdenum-binding subunit
MSYPFAKGDVEKGFQESDVVIEESFSVPYQVQAHMETQCTIASVDFNGKVTCYSPCQFPFYLRFSLSQFFDIPIGMINVVSPFVGGSFGSRLCFYNEPIAVALALKTHKPVKIEYSMEEDFGCLCLRDSHEYTVKMGFKKDGTLHAFYLNILSWGDPYGRGIASGPLMLFWGLGHYRCPNAGGENLGVYTNSPRTFAMRGAGNPEVMWGVEQVVDMAAIKLKMDPLKIRLKNIKKVGEPFNLGPVPIESTYLDDCIKTGAEAIGWDKKPDKKEEGSKRRGVGMATMSHCSGAFPVLPELSGARVNFNEDGSINLTVNPGSPGTHIWGTLSQIAAEELGINVEDVHIVTGETEKVLWELGSHASRSTYVIGNAVLNAAREAKGQLLEWAAKMLGTSSGELEVKNRRVFLKSAPNKSLFVSEVVQNAAWDSGGNAVNFAGNCSFRSTSASPPTAAYFAEVEVDTETGEVKILKFILAVDCGTAINPMTVEGQCEGAIQQGLGYALTEDFFYNRKTGVVGSDNFTTYKMFSSVDMPETEVIIINKPDPKGPFGAKGIGEPGLVGVAPAIANAIYNAVGVRIRDLPITPEKVLKALKEKQLKSGGS